MRVPTSPSSTASLTTALMSSRRRVVLALGDVVAQPPDHFTRAVCLLADPLDDVAHAIRI